METFPFIQEKYLPGFVAPYTTTAGWICAKSCCTLPNLPLQLSAGQWGKRSLPHPLCN